MPVRVAKQAARDAAAIRSNLFYVIAQESERLGWLAHDQHGKYLTLSAIFDATLDPGELSKLYDRLSKRFAVLVAILERLCLIEDMPADLAQDDPIGFKSKVAAMTPAQRENLRKLLKLLREWDKNS